MKAFFSRAPTEGDSFNRVSPSEETVAESHVSETIPSAYADAAALKFNICPSPEMPPSTLLFTQNIGGIDVGLGGFDSSILTGAATPKGEPTKRDNGEARAPPTVGSSGFSGVPTAVLDATNPSTNSLAFCTPVTGNNTSQQPRSAVEIGQGALVPERAKQMVAELIAELRRILHRLSQHWWWRCQHQLKTTQTPTGPEQNGDSAPAATTDKQSAEEVNKMASESATPPLLDVIIIHFQEIGGKRIHRAFNEYFAEQLARFLLPEAGWTSGLLMENSNETNSFTALGTIVFLSPRICPLCSILAFPHRTYIPVNDDPRTYGGASTTLYHAAKFSSAGTSRKGFLLLSLRIGTTMFNVCNVHLFHDDDNTVAVASSPSIYTRRRTDALLEAVAECLSVVGKDEPLFFFGDLNTRLDGKRLVAFVKDRRAIDVHVEKKKVRCPDTFWAMFSQAKELEAIRAACDTEVQRHLEVVAEMGGGLELAELPVTFSPTYPREPREICSDCLADQGGQKPFPIPDSARLLESTTQPEPHSPSSLQRLLADPARCFSRLRLPAWCDRVIFNPAALEYMAGGLNRSYACDSAARGASEAGGGNNVAPATIQGVLLPDETALASKMYLYESTTLPHTDHDGVFLLF